MVGEENGVGVELAPDWAARNPGHIAQTPREFLEDLRHGTQSSRHPRTGRHHATVTCGLRVGMSRPAMPPPSGHERVGHVVGRSARSDESVVSPHRTRRMSQGDTNLGQGIGRQHDQM